MKAHFVARRTSDLDLEAPVNDIAVAGKTKKEITFDKVFLDTHKIFLPNKADILIPWNGILVGTLSAEIVPRENSRVRLTVERRGQVEVPEYWINLSAHQFPFRLLVTKGDEVCWMVENYIQEGAPAMKLSLQAMKNWSITVNCEVESIS